MHRVVIVEDEPKISDLILHLIQWEQLGLEVVAQCGTGPIALEYITKHHPDIVLTDIKLPGLDGLELISKVRELGLPTAFVIISGYRQFDYAKKALQHGVEEYLIKPVNKEELSDVLMRICKKLEQQDESREESKKNSRVLQDLLLARLLAGEVDIGKLTVPNEYGFHISSGQVQCIALSFDEPYATLSEEYLEDILSITQSVLTPLCYQHIPYIKDNHILYILCNFPAGAIMTMAYSKLFQAVKQYIDQHNVYNPILTLAVGAPQTHTALHFTLFFSANMALQYRLQTRCNWIIYYEQIKQDLHITPLMRREDLAAMAHYAELLDFKAFQTLVIALFKRITPQISPLEVEHLIDTIITNVSDVVHQILPETDYSAIASTARKDFDRQYTLSGLQQTVLSWCENEFQRAIVGKKARGSRPVYDALQYIALHYASPITLEELAQTVQLNPSYFSTLFKKETGYNFSDYLAEVRIDEAKKQLRDTTKSIASIGEDVGYPDNRYFSRVFTKVIGVKPSAYRSLHR